MGSRRRRRPVDGCVPRAATRGRAALRRPWCASTRWRPIPTRSKGSTWRKSRGQTWVDVGPSTVGEIAYERLPIEAVIAMTEGVASIDLSAVDRPVLLVTSANDDVVDPASSDVIADALQGDVQRLRLRTSGHVATLDNERHLLQRAVVDFVSAHRRSPTRPVSGSTGSRRWRDR